MRLTAIFALSCLPVAVMAQGQGHPSQGLEQLLDKVKEVRRDGQGVSEASRAASKLSEEDASNLMRILGGFEGANPLAANMLRSAVETMVDRAAGSGQTLPTRELALLVTESPEKDPRARQLAFEILKKGDPAAADKILPDLLNDRNPVLRRAAVEHWIQEAVRQEGAGEDAQAKTAYERALEGAVDDDQVKSIAKGLKSQGIEVNIQEHFAFLTDWKIVGPFDNRGMVGFDIAYPPESNSELDKRYPGQLGEVAWQPLTTEDDYGVVDIAQSLENYKGSVMYLRTQITSPREQDVEIRLGTANAWKLWLNGEYLFGREEYHRGMSLDQYRIPARLQDGENVLLLKLLQNEQSQDWAQSYKFQLRLTDESGRALRFAD